MNIGRETANDSLPISEKRLEGSLLFFLRRRGCNVLYDLLDMSQLGICKARYLNISPAVQFEEIICRYRKEAGKFHQHINGGENVIVFPVGNRLF